LLSQQELVNDNLRLLSAIEILNGQAAGYELAPAGPATKTGLPKLIVAPEDIFGRMMKLLLPDFLIGKNDLGLSIEIKIGDLNTRRRLSGYGIFLR